MSNEERAARLREQIKKTWSPPLSHGKENAADIAQTAVMISLAFVFGRSFLGELTESQNAAITSGLEIFGKVID